MWSKKKLVSNLFAAFFTSLVVFFQTRELILSAVFDKSKDLLFFGEVLFRDSTIHLGIIQELLKNFPAKNFVYTAEGLTPLKNYHYLYDLILAGVIKLTGLDINLVYFRIAPPVISILLCLTIYLATLRISKDRLAASFSIFFVVFATSLGPLISGTNQGTNIFMSDQLLGILINPHGGLILVIFLAIYIFLNLYERGYKKALIPYFLLLALSFSLKAYGGIVFAFGACSSALVFFLQKKDRLMPIITGSSLITMGFLVYLTVDSKVPGLSFAPFWTLERMIRDSDKLNRPNFTSRSLGKLFLIPLYFAGNLGFRIFALYGIWEKVRKPSIISPSFVFLLSAACLSFFLPIFFNQGNKAYDIVQFTPYFLIFMGIMFTVSLFHLISKFKSKFLKAGTIGIFMIFFIILNRSELQAKLFLTGDKYIIKKDLVSAAIYIKKHSSEDAIFLLPMSDFNLGSHWFNYLAERRTVYSGWRFADQLGISREKAVPSISAIFSGENKSVSFDYVFLQKQGDPPGSDKIREHYKLVPWFENETVVILKKAL